MALCRNRLFALALALVALSAAARADDYSRVTLLEENDSLYFNSDKHYTQGLRFDYLSPSLSSDSWWTGPFDLLARTPLFAASPADRRVSWLLGQSVFTPEALQEAPPDPHDRPYAGWLYAGTSLLQRNADDTLDNLEADLGVVGPWAFAEAVQNDWHQYVIGISGARGWGYQLHNEPGLVLAYDRHWRLPVIGDERTFGADVVPETGATVGNVFDYGEIGVMARLGTGLAADYGPVRVRPALSGTDYFDSSAVGDGPGGYFYIGAQGRAVGHNIFLDGNTFRSSASVPRKVLVADVEAGFAVFWSRRARLDFSVTQRTEEFYGQRTPDVIGTAALSFSL